MNSKNLWGRKNEGIWRNSWISKKLLAFRSQHSLFSGQKAWFGTTKISGIKVIIHIWKFFRIGAKASGGSNCTSLTSVDPKHRSGRWFSFWIGWFLGCSHVIFRGVKYTICIPGIYYLLWCFVDIFRASHEPKSSSPPWKGTNLKGTESSETNPTISCWGEIRSFSEVLLRPCIIMNLKNHISPVPKIIPRAVAFFGAFSWEVKCSKSTNHVENIK